MVTTGVPRTLIRERTAEKKFTFSWARSQGRKTLAHRGSVAGVHTRGRAHLYPRFLEIPSGEY